MVGIAVAVRWICAGANNLSVPLYSAGMLGFAEDERRRHRPLSVGETNDITPWMIKSSRLAGRRATIGSSFDAVAGKSQFLASAINLVGE